MTNKNTRVIIERKKGMTAAIEIRETPETRDNEKPKKERKPRAWRPTEARLLKESTARAWTEITTAIIKAICYNHGWKMKDVLSISTSPLLNKWCMIRAAIKELVCHKCFSMLRQKLYPTLKEKLKRNTRLLCDEVIPEEQIPTLPDKIEIFRLESFGDLQTAEQFINYLTIARNNPHIHVTLWTKNRWIIHQAVHLYRHMPKQYTEKPKNLVIIYSSPRLNYCDMSALKDPWIDKVFTVYKKDYARENNIRINCGARSCNTCRRCYSKRTAKVINELLK